MENLMCALRKLKLKDRETDVLEMLDLQEIETYPLTNECLPGIYPHP